MKDSMNTIKHHLNDALLMAYSAGTLPEAFDLVVATHLSMCDDCRARAMSFDSVGGAMLDTCDLATLSGDCFASTMEKIMGTKTIVAPPKAAKTILPKPVCDYIGGDLDAVKWRPIGMGVKQAILPTNKAASARLLFIPAGTAVPDHGHRGSELTLVLRGAFHDQTDYFGAGDIEIANEDLNHTPIADIGADCICLAATDAPLKFSGILPRLAQPFFRI